MATVYLMRHGQTEYTSSHRICGSGMAIDPPLSPLGEETALSKQPVIQKIAPDAVYASPILRCQMTAKIAAEDHEIITDPRLREIHFGEFEGLPMAAVMPDGPESVFKGTPYLEMSFPGGDNLAVYYENAGKTLREYLADPRKTLLLVTHAGFIGCVAGNLIYDDPIMFVKYPIRPCEILKLEEADGKILLERFG